MRETASLMKGALVNPERLETAGPCKTGVLGAFFPTYIWLNPTAILAKAQSVLLYATYH